MQIRKRLPIIMNLLVCIPLIVLAIVTYAYSSKKLVEKGENYIQELTVSEGRALSALIESKMYQVNIIASDRRVIDTVKYKNRVKYLEVGTAFLNETLVNDDDYDVVILDSKGHVITAASGKDNSITLRDYKEFEKVIEGKVSYKNILDSYLDDQKSVNITVPIKDEYGVVIGAVCKIISNQTFNHFMQSVRIANTGYGFVVNQEGYVKIHHDPEQEGQPLESNVLMEHIKELVKQNESRGSCTYQVGREEQYCSYFMVPRINWIICVTQSVNEMQQEAITGCMLTVLTLLILIIIVYFSCKRFTKRITAPIDQIMRAMEGNKHGKLDTLCDYEGEDEFGTLANTYNEMVRKLGDSHHHLNAVSEELAVTKKELKENFTELEKSKEALVVSEEKYKMTLEAIDEGIWEYNVESKKFAATENVYQIIGKKVDFSDIIAVVNDLVESQYAHNFRLTLSRCIVGEIENFTQELPIYIGDEKRWLLCKGHAMYSGQNDIKKIIGILTDITHNKQNEEQVKKLSFFDGLTGCLNKETFIDNVDSCLCARNFKKNAALLFIDLDDFKRINDTLGHDVGDKILNYVGNQLREVLSQDTIVGRFSGDAFVVFKAQLRCMSEVHELICTILNLFKHKIDVGTANSVHITCSMGVAICPTDGKDSAMLLRNADTAMYKAKEDGKNSYSFYTPAMTQKLDRRLLIEDALREAIGKRSFKIQYQPIIDAKTQKTIGCEALVRLMDSELGIVSPGEFIPIAEETSLIIEVGDWVMENALYSLKAYHDKGYKDFYMNINVSSIQIKQPNFLDKFIDILEKTQAPKEFVKLEVTETVLMQNINTSAQLFSRIKGLGIKIALDDFGTGYSSLNYLRSIPLDILKIDKSFIDEITTSNMLSEIVDSIMNMAHALDIVVVAEGVESNDQFELLKEKGCDLIQGYYFSKPLDGEDLEIRLKDEYYPGGLLDKSDILH